MDFSSFESDSAFSAPEPVDFFAGLNDAQKEAVNITEGALLVLAGAGTGKTRVLTTRIAHIIQSGLAWPAQILSVTFTNKAAKEMKQRIETMIPQRSQGLWLGTFHSIGVRILRQHAEAVGLKSDFTILDTDDQLRLIKQMLSEHKVDDKRNPPKRLAGIISSWKDRGLTPEKVSAVDAVEFANGKAKELYKEYQARLKSLNACDFGDLLLHNLTLFLNYPEILKEYQRRFKYILVDEYQDTNIAQYLWLRLLAQGSKNICCVGDDDQSIYGWRGAEVGNILKFEKDFDGAKVIRLECNYRSTPVILAAASGLIDKNKERLGKTLWTESKGGELIKLLALWDDREEAGYIVDEIESLQQLKQHPLNEIAILVRAGFQTRAFEEAFINRGVPYKVIGGLRFYERMEIRDAIAYFRIISQPADDLAFERIVNTPKRGIGAASIQAIRKRAKQSRDELASNIDAPQMMLGGLEEEATALSMLEATRKMLAEGNFSGRAKNSLAHLCEQITRWQSLFDTMPIAEAAEAVLRESGYIGMWQQEKTPEAQGRVENLKELLRALEEFESFSEFLEHVSLVTDTEDKDNNNMVSIMTLHAAKGLEFNSVFLPGWEEGLFPHQRALDENGTTALEEERRLAYVGITRARKRAYISFAANRRIYNQYQSSIPSRFVDELPPESVEAVQVNNGFNYGRGRGLDARVVNPTSLGDNIPSFTSKRAVNTGASSSKTETSTAGFKNGQRVFHQKFGYGKVKAITGDKLTIKFEKAGEKTVIDEYVQMA